MEAGIYLCIALETLVRKHGVVGSERETTGTWQISLAVLVSSENHRPAPFQQWWSLAVFRGGLGRMLTDHLRGWRTGANQQNCIPPSKNVCPRLVLNLCPQFFVNE